MTRTRAWILTPVLLAAVGCVGGQNPLPPGVDAGGDPGAGGGGGGPSPGVGGRGGPAPGEGGRGGTTGGTGGSGGTAGGGGPAACKPEDCKNAPVPAIGCADGTAPTFTCTRLPSGACGWTNPMCPGRDAGAGPDGPTRTDAPPVGGGMCGNVTCGPGTVCCNASCGICTPPGQACIQIACLPDAGGTPTPGACRTNDDCRLFDDYCTGCDCRALAKADPDPKCSGPGVRCILPPCQGKSARCEAGKCVVANPDGTTARWWLSCGDPVCGGWRPKPDVPRCMPNQQAGLACSPASAKPCDPGNDCNALLVCATSDPTKQPGGCPRSRRETKRDVHYLSPEELRQYHDQLLGMKLATWRYKHDPARERLGFIIDDQPARSVAVAPPGEIVDLYGYTSLAVATLQLQARELEALRAQVADLERKMNKLERNKRR